MINKTIGILSAVAIIIPGVIELLKQFVPEKENSNGQVKK